MNLSDGNGSKIFIGPATTSADPSTYSGLAWTEVKGVETIPEFGDNSSIITFTALDSGRVHKRKGPSDAGDITVVFGRINGDEGQDAMTAAANTRQRYAFKVVPNDAPDADYTNSALYFGALVNGPRTNVGQSNAVNKRSYSLVIDTPIYEVAPVEVS